MKIQEFVDRYLPEAKKAGEEFKMNPVVMLAQAAIESGCGESRLARLHHNLFGITAYGASNDYWHGCRVQLSEDSKLRFRKYADTQSSFLDYARLITRVYPQAAAMSFHPEAFAKEIAYSRYISELNGDNREEYRKSLCKISRQILQVKGKKAEKVQR